MMEWIKISENHGKPGRVGAIQPGSAVVEIVHDYKEMEGKESSRFTGIDSPLNK